MDEVAAPIESRSRWPEARDSQSVAWSHRTRSFPVTRRAGPAYPWTKPWSRVAVAPGHTFARTEACP
jgi:hypothetical protein